MKILVVDDEPAIVETLASKLEREGFSAITAQSAEEGLAQFRKHKPDLVILDVMLPNRSGFDFCHYVRKSSETPIIILSARADETSRIKGLELGADDYVTKPFHLNELTARVRAVLRRTSGAPQVEPLTKGNLRIDPTSHEVVLEEVPLELSPKEYALLLFLVQNQGKVFTREVLLDRVWGQDAFVNERTVDVHIRWLRTHIESEPKKPTRIVTVRSVGYKFAG